MASVLKKALGDSGIEASVVALGTWAIGGDGWGKADNAQAIEAIHESIDSGINFIDTAPIYGFGHAEELVGEVLASRRDEVVLSSKCGLRWNVEVGEFNFEDGAGNKIYKCLSPESIRFELEESLRRLRTDYIDLYHTHWQTQTAAIEDTMAELLKQKEAGKIRAIGVSNVSQQELDNYQASGSISCVQEMFSMIDRQHETGLFPKARETNVAVLAYSPLAMGLLSGALGPDRTFDANDNRSWSPRFTVENRRKVSFMLDELGRVAANLNMTLPQLVISWTVAQPTITHVLCGARTAQYAKENAVGGYGWVNDSTLEIVDAILDRHKLKVPHPFLPEE